MAILRRKSFSTQVQSNPDDLGLIDTPEKLLRFAEPRGLVSIPLNVEKIADALGIGVEFLSFPSDEEDLSGKLFHDVQSGKWRIHVNAQHHPNRQRYTIAHEIAHFFLHRHLQDVFEDKIFFRGGEATKEEYQANEFASALLMPESAFRREIKSGKVDVEELAKFFQVSTLALRLRAKNLGMAGHGL